MSTKTLDVYIQFDFNDNIDIDVIEKLIHVVVRAKYNYKVNIFRRMALSTTKSSDIIRRGLTYIKSAYETLKLKSSNDVWIVYIGTGKIHHLPFDVSVLLLYNDPFRSEALYVINKDLINVQKHMHVPDKLEKLKNISNMFEEVLTSKKTIKLT
jgi:hypothetical protein